MHIPSDQHPQSAGHWISPENEAPEEGYYAFETALQRVQKPVFIVEHDNHLAVSNRGQALITSSSDTTNASLKRYPLRAFVPPLPPSELGSRLFRKRYGLSYAYVMGAMANGITSVEMVTAAGRAGMIAFFGAAGLRCRGDSGLWWSGTGQTHRRGGRLRGGGRNPVHGNLRSVG